MPKPPAVTTRQAPRSHWTLVVTALAFTAAGLATVSPAVGQSVLDESPRVAAGPDQPPTATATPAKDDLVAPGATVTRAATGFTFTEGPAADRAGDVYFTDVRTSRIHKWTASDNSVALYRDQTGGANGLYFTPAGHLVVCESTNRRMTEDDLAGNIRVLADAYDGKKLNSPNDVWVRPDGGIYFSDPRYGDQTGVEQDGMHVYYIPPGGGPLTRVTQDLLTPNGLIGTPEGATLYIADAGAGQVWRYRVQADGTLADKAPFVGRGVDGMTMDERLNVYLATGAGIEVFDPAGVQLATIRVAERPSNVTFGGQDFRTLFITARTSVYTLRMAVRGAGSPELPELTATATGTAEVEGTATPTVPPGSFTSTATATATATDPAPRWWAYLPLALRGLPAPVTAQPERSATRRPTSSATARDTDRPPPTDTATPTPSPTPTTAPPTPPLPSGVILVDHESVALFDRIPENYLQDAAGLRQLFIDKSVGANISDYLTCLTYPSTAEAPSRCRRVEHQAPEFALDPALLAWSRPGGYDRSRWVYAPWEGNCGGWYDLVGCFTAMAEPVIDDYDVLSFQVSYLEVMPGSTIAGPQGFFADSPRAGDVHDLAAFEARHPDKTFLYWTSSLARGIGSAESDSFNDQMRAYTREQGRPLFDVADILSHDPTGQPCFDNRDGRPYGNEDHPDDGVERLAICQHYTTESEGGHLGSVSGGGIRVAKAYWVLMAQMAGWDGQAQGSDPEPGRERRQR